MQSLPGPLLTFILTLATLSPAVAQMGVTDAEMRHVVRNCMAMIEEEVGAGAAFPSYEASALDSSIGMIGTGGNGDQLRLLLRSAPYVDQEDRAVETLQKAREYELGPEMMLEFAVEQKLSDRTIFQVYQCFTSGPAARSVLDSISFEY